MPDSSNHRGTPASRKAEKVVLLGKYGLPVGTPDPMLERHLKVTGDERAIAAVEIDRSMKALPGLAAALKARPPFKID